MRDYDIVPMLFTIISTGSNNYNCTFPAMIDDWRGKWHTSTMEQTDPLFGFGFVQVAIDCSRSASQHIIKIFQHSWQLMATTIKPLEDFQLCDGLKLPIMATYQTIGYRMSSWLLQWIWVIHSHPLGVFILEISRMLETDLYGVVEL